MMRQFFSMKAKHPDALLLFRCGDFYETYCDDAVEASKILGLDAHQTQQRGIGRSGDGRVPTPRP